MTKHKRHKRKPHSVRIKKPFIRKPFFWFSFVLLAFILGSSYLFIFAERFQITEIQIHGNEKVLTKDIEDIVSNIINRVILGKNFKNIFLVRKNKINSEILNKFPEIEDIKTKKDFPDTLILEIKERKPFAIFCTEERQIPGQCFVLDNNGVIFEIQENLNFLDNTLIIRFSENEREFSLGQEIIKKELLDLILRIRNNQKENDQPDIKEVIFSLPQRLNVKTTEDWQIYFNLESDVDLQITKLNLLLKELISLEDREGLEYIDLRFTRAYYK